MHRIFTTAISLLLTSAALTSPARAGGLGVLATGGVHTENVYFYSNADPDGNPYSDLADYDQYIDPQRLSHVGGGLNLLLGDRDDRIIGDCRFYWVMDSAQNNPASSTTAVKADTIVNVYRDKPRHIGLGMVGLSWGIVGDPSKFQLNAVGHVGSAFITLDHTEFLAVDIGPGVSYRVARQIQVFGELAYQARFRKNFSHSANAFVGARYMFD